MCLTRLGVVGLEEESQSMAGAGVQGGYSAGWHSRRDTSWRGPPVAEDVAVARGRGDLLLEDKEGVDLDELLVELEEEVAPEQRPVHHDTAGRVALAAALRREAGPA